MRNPLHVAIISDFCYPVYMGGSSKHVFDIMRGLESVGIEATLLTRSMDNTTQYSAEDSDAENLFVKWCHGGRVAKVPVSLFWNPIRYANFIKNADIVAIEHPIMGCVGAIVARLMNKKVIYHYHGPIHLEYKLKSGKKNVRYYVLWLMQKITCLLSHKLMVHSDYMGNIAISEHDVQQDKITLLPPYIEPVTIFGDISSLPPKNQLWILIPRRLTARTGVVQFIETFVKLPKEIKDSFHIFVSGRGELQQTVESLVKEDSTHLTYMGFLSYSQLWKMYGLVDAVCVPTVDLEGFGYVILEGMMEGAAPIVSDTCGGGYDFVMKELGKNWSFKVGNIESLSKVLKLLQTKSLGREDFKSIARKYSTQNMLRTYREIVDSL